MNACPHCGTFVAFPKQNDKCPGGGRGVDVWGWTLLELTSHKIHLGRKREKRIWQNNTYCLLCWGLGLLFVWLSYCFHSQLCELFSEVLLDPYSNSSAQCYTLCLFFFLSESAITFLQKIAAELDLPFKYIRVSVAHWYIVAFILHQAI